MVSDNIYNLLAATATLTAIIPAENIGWVNVEELTAYPKLEYRCIDAPTMLEATDEWQRWRFHIVHYSKTQCAAVALILTGLLNNSHGLIDGTYFDYISKILESPLELRDDNQYEQYIDFRIMYH